MTTEIKEYTTDIENLFLQFFVSDPELFVRCMGIIKPDHYDNITNKKLVKLLLEHTQQYASLPTIEQIKAMLGKTVEKIELREADKDWFLAEYETFSRFKELALAIHKSPDLLEEHRYGEVEAIIKAAVSIGLVKDLGTDYFKDPVSRLEAVQNSGGMVSTGWKSIDKPLYGGLNRGEITIFAGASGAGKSLFLQNIALNFVEQGLNVVYLSLELSENLCSMRLDAMLSDMGTRDVMKNKDNVALKVVGFQRKHKGSLRIKQLKNGCTANDVKAYIKEYETQTNIKVDAILLDYLDLCMPTNVKVSPSDLFVKDKYVTENMRDLAVELKTILVTASQLNRSAVEAVEFDHSHISGGLSKIQTADNVIGIFTTNTMKENGRYQIQFLKTRSSSGVGNKVDLGFNIRSLRIHDLESGDESSAAVGAKSIIDKLKTQSVLDQGAEATESVLDKTNSLLNIMQNLRR